MLDVACARRHYQLTQYLMVTPPTLRCGNFRPPSRMPRATNIRSEKGKRPASVPQMHLCLVGDPATLWRHQHTSPAAFPHPLDCQRHCLWQRLRLAQPAQYHGQAIS